MVGCSPQTQSAQTQASAVDLADSDQAEQDAAPVSQASKLESNRKNPDSVQARSPDTSGLPDTQTEQADSSGDDVTKFVGQDGRERIVPTGPPPTDRDGRLELTFDDLSFEMEKGDPFERSMLTDRIKSFHGADVRLRGFIRPSFRQSKIEKFVFVRDDKECCFGPGAAIYDNALVSLKKGTQTDYTVRPVVVTGQLHLKEYQAPDGMILSIYRIKNGKIE